MNSAIIVAAGSGKRFGGDIPKQFLEILDKPVLIHTLQKFENCPIVDEIILVLSIGQIENFSRKLEHFPSSKLTKIVSGGETRAQSVFNGLNEIDRKSAGIIAVHDGARPIVTSEEITKTIEKAKETGAACLVGKVTDTIKTVSEGKIFGTIDRENLRRALTPQCFQFEILKRAFEGADLTESATDECFLVEKLGYEISYVEGSARNIKITTKEDLEIAKVFLREQ